MKINVTINWHDQALHDRVDMLESKTHRLEEVAENQMTFNETMDGRIAAMDTATTAIANELSVLRQQLADGSLSEAERTAILAKLDAHIATLTQLGADPNNPVPVPNQ